MTQKTFLVLSLILLLSGCASNHHAVLGTSWGWDAEKYDVQVLLDAQVDALRVRHVRMKSSTCVSGYRDHLELQGAIGPESTAAVERLLPKLAECRDSSGGKISRSVYLSSGGGRLIDGFALGELLREYQMSTAILNEQSCASSCAIAFLGGKFRHMQKDAQLIFHAPYTQSYLSIDCSDRGQVAALGSYFSKMLNSKDGKFLLDRTMSYCSTSDGWTVNADGAKLFGIIK